MAEAISEELAEKLKMVPDAPGCYIIKDAAGRALYVGKARSLRHRLRQHFSESRPMHPWHQHMMARAADFEFIVTNSELEALILENTLIKKLKPRYNIKLADDKSYPYLLLTDELYPRLMILRDLPEAARVAPPQMRRGFHDPKRHEVHSLSSGRIFGPYADAGAMRKTMRLVSQLFGLRSCRKQLSGEPVGQPCLNYHIGRCVGPCTGKVPPEEYAKLVRQAVMFLRGHVDEVIDKLRQEMDQAARNLQFEKAAILRDRIRAIERSTQEQAVVFNDTVDRDVLAAAQEADKAVVVHFVVRAGKLIQQNQMVFTQADKHAPEEAIVAFMSQHYPAVGDVPREILVSHEIPEAEQWQELLEKLRGGPVEIHQPKRGEKRRLVEMALRNAALAVARVVASQAESRRAGRLAVEDLAAALGLEKPPRRIECYDVSTAHGEQTVGSMVVFTDGLPDKSAYRRFRIAAATAGHPDDYAAMEEMLRRRIKRAVEGDEKFLPLPDLIIVDGGRGQLGVAEKVLRDEGLAAHIALAAIAKEHEDVFVPGRSEPVDMTHHPRAHYLIQRIRNEAHRFAISHHRKLREREAMQSLLDEAPGIGPKRKAALLRAFPSVHDMARASVDELAAVEGMTRAAAEQLKRFLAERLQV